MKFLLDIQSGMGRFVEQRPLQDQSFFADENQAVSFREHPIPSLGPRNVLVHVKCTGICKSDVHYWKHGVIGQYIVQAPLILGHKSSGVFTAIGSDVQHLDVGDRVALEPGSSCRRCTRCREGR